ncbi:MAG: napF2 [Pedosphaera sp.]|nr:napF2 [Pedosphaera sp.]
MAAEKGRFWLTFDAGGTTKPLIWEMSKKFDLVFNIRNSSVTPTLGVVAIELRGPKATIDKAIRWFTRKGVHVDPVELSTIEG